MELDGESGDNSSIGLMPWRGVELGGCSRVDVEKSGTLGELCDLGNSVGRLGRLIGIWVGSGFLMELDGLSFNRMSF